MEKNSPESIEKLLLSLQERAKELNCLYEIEEILSKPNDSLTDVFRRIINAIPAGWQYPDVCKVRLVYGNRICTSPDFTESPWLQRADIVIQESIVGSLEVYYTEERPTADEGPFLKEERKLITTIAERLGHYLLHRRLRQMFMQWESAREDLTVKKKAEWRVILELLKRTDQPLFIRISRKMMNYLSWRGIEDAADLIQSFGSDQSGHELVYEGEVNQPLRKTTVDRILHLSDQTFKVAEQHLSDEEILSNINRWLHEDKAGFLVRTLENLDSSLNEIADALNRFYHLGPSGIEIAETTKNALVVSLVRRFFTDQLEFINVAKKYLTIRDFYDLTKRIIFPYGSHGKLGGKSAGLFLATQILKKAKKDYPELKNIQVPKTWYIASDGVLSFIHYNNMEEVFEQKYKSIEQVKQEYPHIVQLFKNSQFPPEILKGLYMALEELSDGPLIVRSSSLLEDRLGTAFSGKYKSLFIANTGSREERLEALLDAIAEVYASVFSPDPIEYRSERGLLDFHEEMGIMIQQVVGKKVGHYFFPAYAGVAFSNNEFRWSPRIKREDGLIRLVPGLGTRAVDRLGDDYPILIAPGQPGLRANISVDENIRYSPQKIDVINLKTHQFETLDVRELIRSCGEKFPALYQLISVVKDERMLRPSFMDLDLNKDEFAVTFEGLVSGTPFIQQMKAMLDILKESLGTPVDMEFASDGENFYLLQCRPQSYSQDTLPATIPKGIPNNKILFTASKYVSNGLVPEVSHVVYVDADGYSSLEKLSQLKRVGRAIGKLNKLLPRRQFILIGPGRWGSRGDIKLGVNVTYSDINNAAMLIEVARKKGNYVPDLSFGTHFFQDLVESAIRYLPLYPDEANSVFNDWMIKNAKNRLTEYLPEYEDLSDVVYVMDVPEETGGLVLQVRMNADLNEAIGYLVPPQSVQALEAANQPSTSGAFHSDDHWRWRTQVAEKLAKRIDPERFGVKALYLFGSSLEGTASAGSDLDIIIHFGGTEQQRHDLEVWLDAWSQALGMMNYLKTGYRTYKLLDYHIVTDDDFARKDSYAMKVREGSSVVRKLELKAVENSGISSDKNGLK
ncbi:MAG: hypothetical protein Kow0037_08140 [Calditrichia bacterium]